MAGKTVDNDESTIVVDGKEAAGIGEADWFRVMGLSDAD